ncbi:unnamed protein product [Ectocarpus sp. CCAP 1310/34]|nr:unnamed protein product [Ectocarpus sp. CCAP 1310/34]
MASLGQQLSSPGEPHLPPGFRGQREPPLHPRIRVALLRQRRQREEVVGGLGYMGSI